MIENCPMRHENGNYIPAGGFCTANKNICEALLNAYKMGKAQLSQEDTTSDMISRQAAIDEIKSVYEWHDTVTMERLIEHINNLPTIQPEVLACGNGELVAKPEPQWIPVERELPEDFTDVLVWFEYFRYGDYNCLYQTHGIGTYVANYNLWTVNHETGWKDLRVIAWMPLPELYKPNK